MRWHTTCVRLAILAVGSERMRCVLRPTERMTFAAWCAVPVVLVLMGVPAEAFAQSPVCHPVRRGESAAQIARRVTGDGRNAYQTWFQIKNTSSRFVPKSQYNRIRAGWQACVMKAVGNRPSAITQFTAAEASGPSNVPDVSPALDVSESSSAAAAPDAPAPTVLAAAQPASIHVTDRAATSPQSDGSPLLRMIRSVDVTMVLLGAAMVVPWFGWRILDDYLVRRRTTAIVMRHFAHRFVDEFERPLIRCHATERPVRSALRCSVRRGRFDVLLAPGEGRRYPNLLDHKKNVEYDVSRVMGVLADDSFVTGPLYTQAGWVVVPFQFKSGQKQPGVPCISSF
jgi:hypothetical protein